MATSSAIDLSQLPKPTLDVVLDAEVVLAAHKAKALEIEPDLDTSDEADPAVAVLEVGAYRETLIRQDMKETALAQLLVGAYQADDGEKPDAVEIYCNGRWSEIDHGKSNAKDGTEHKYTSPLVYYRRVVNGITEVEIDMLNGIFLVNGVDRYAEIMAILTS